MKKTIYRIFLSVVVLLLAANLFSSAIMKNYVPGEKYFCKLGYFIAFELPKGDTYSVEYEESEDWAVEHLDSYVFVYPDKQDKRLEFKVCNSKNRFIDLVVESKPRDFPEPAVMKVIVEKFPENTTPTEARGRFLKKLPPVPPQKFLPNPSTQKGIVKNENNEKFLEVQKPFYKKVSGRRRQGRWVFDNAISLQGGLLRGGSNHFNLDGELIVNAKSSKGLLFQGAGKVIYNDYIKKYGVSIGGGFEPGNIGLFLFVDSLAYEFNDFDSTFHVQVRPTVRLKLKKLSASLFYAIGFGDQYTGVDALELSPQGEVIGIYNKVLSHFGLNVKAFIFDKLYIKLKAVAASGNVYKVDLETGFELFKNLYVTGNYNISNFGKYPELAMNGYADQSTFGIGIRYLFGNRNKPNYDLRFRNIVATDYPIVVSYTKVKEKKEVKKEEEEEQKPTELTVNLTGNPLSGKAPLSVDFTAQAKGGQSPYKYKWYFEGQGNDSTYGKEKETHTYYHEGTYRVYVEVEDNKGSKATSNKLKIDVSDSGKYKIIAKAHEGASIKPSGTILAEPGGDYRFEMSSLEGYKIERVEVDGKNIGAVIEYTFKDVDRDHRIEVWAKKDDGIKQYKIVSISNNGGYNEPEGTILVNQGDSLTVKIFAVEGYRVKDVKVDGKSIGSAAEYRFEEIEADHTIESFFEVSVFTIEAIQNSGGNISPPGITQVEKGGSQTYTIIASEGHELTDLLVDGISVGVPQGDTYTFSNVNANHTIEPLFGQQTFVINASAEGGGTIVESGAVQVVYGSDKTFKFTANEGWEATELTIDGAVVPVPESNEYTFVNVTTNHTIHIKFTKIKYTITVLYNQGGTVTPGTCEVEHGSDKTFEISPLVSHNITDVKVDGGSYGPVVSYTFNKVTANHTLEAIFVIKTFDITVITNEGTTCTPGSITVTYGSNQTFAFGTDSPGRYISDVKIDNVSKGEQSEWTFTKITKDHRIELFSEWYYYTISETHQVGGRVVLNGQVNPGSVQVRWGESCQCSFAVNSSSGKEIQDIKIDGVSKGVIETWNFENVTKDHAVHLDTQWIYYTIDVNWQGNGQIIPGTTQVKHGESQSFRMVPDSDYRVKILKVDNAVVPATDLYTFSNVTADHTIYAEFERLPIQKFTVIYGGYTFQWWEPAIVPDYGEGGGGLVVTEQIEEGQVFEYTYPAYVKDEELPIQDQFDIPFEYVLINGVKYYDRHISIRITGNTTIEARYSLDNR